MIENIKGYSYNDLTLVPVEISNVSSRSECNPFIGDKFLPIFTAPMASVVNFENYEKFLDNGITPIIPRNISLEVRKDLMNDQQWTALSMKEFEDLFINNYLDRIGDFRTHYFICVDIANGHKKSLYDKCITAKKNADAGDYKLTIMTVILQILKHMNGLVKTQHTWIKMEKENVQLILFVLALVGVADVLLMVQKF